MHVKSVRKNNFYFVFEAEEVLDSEYKEIMEEFVEGFKTSIRLVVMTMRIQMIYLKI